MMMKAAVLFGNEDIRYADWPKPRAGAGELVVRVRASGICGSDVPRVLHNGAHFYPIVLGHEFAGEVTEIGPGVEGFAIGDRVSGAPLLPCMACGDCLRGNYSLCKHYSFIGSREQGSFAQYVKLPAANAIRFDPSLSFAQGAFFEPSTVALHGLLLADFQGGGNVLVLGGGTIGLFAMQWAKIFGAKSVTVVDISEERLALCKEFGAEEVINTRHASIPSGAYEYVFETAGNVHTMRAAFEAAGNRAHVCFIGTPTAELTFSPKLFENMNRKEFRLTGSWMSYSAPFPGKEWPLTAHYFATGQLRFCDKLIFKTFPLSRAADAFALYKTPGAVGGKIMLCSEEE